MATVAKPAADAWFADQLRKDADARAREYTQKLRTRPQMYFEYTQKLRTRGPGAAAQRSAGLADAERLRAAEPSMQLRKDADARAAEHAQKLRPRLQHEPAGAPVDRTLVEQTHDLERKASKSSQISTAASDVSTAASDAPRKRDPLRSFAWTSLLS